MVHMAHALECIRLCSVDKPTASSLVSFCLSAHGALQKALATQFMRPLGLAIVLQVALFHRVEEFNLELGNPPAPERKDTRAFR